MRTRIYVAAAGVPAILAVIFLLPPWAFGITVGLVAAFCAAEFVFVTRSATSNRVVVYCAVSAFLIPLLNSVSTLPMGGIFVAVVLLLILFTEAILAYDTERAVPFSYVALSFFAGAVIPLFLGTLVTLRAIPAGMFLGDGSGRFFGGQVYVLIPIFIAFVSDAGGYFAGHAFGRRKLIEKVSPKKTIEGSLGGFAAAFALMFIFTFVMVLFFDATFNILAIFVFGILGSAVTQIGDLSFSLIKREYGKKDFGHILPGHGGMLDRFDSMILLAPFITALMFWIPPFLQG
ncbi:MAG: phosphatidate cytidylyltransferase [Oscillospiraceae bacterium]|nr:phosphatidate cytidylyltransferase [Oscillospiraceae bacterium]